MLSVSSIFALFAQIAMACIGLLAISEFSKRKRECPQKQFFYNLIIIGFLVGATLNGFLSFLTVILYIFTDPAIPRVLWNYILFVSPIFNWIHWATMTYLFTKRKNVWHVWLFGALSIGSAVIFATAPITLINNQGIITPKGFNWQALMFGTGNIVAQILLFLYVLYYYTRLKRKKKPLKYIKMLLYAFIGLIVTYIATALYIIFLFPPFFILAWLFAALSVTFYYLGLMAVDDENKILLSHPFLYIQRSLKFKMAIVLNVIIWISFVGSVLVITTLVNKTLKPYQEAPIVQQLIKEAVRAQAWFLIVSVLILVVITLAVVYFLTSFLKPVDRLNNAMKIVGEGNLNYRITKVPADELGSFAINFNDMVAHLKKTGKEILYLKELDKLKSQFVSLASHQLRTPLTVIRWSISSLLHKGLKKVDDKEVTGTLNDVYNSTNRMIQLVSDLLNAVRFESATITLNKTSISPVEIIEKIVTHLEMLIKKRNINVTISKSKIDFPTIMADEKMITIALENLVGNAIDYNREGGIIDIKLEDEGNAVCISVVDSGIGIKEEEQKNIFSRFYRSDDAMAIKTEGTGLGLFIAKAIINAHNGKIWFKSTYGKGATFFVQLPKG